MNGFRGSEVEDGPSTDASQRGMLAQLAARLRARAGAAGTAGTAGAVEGDNEGGPIVLDENCSVSEILFRQGQMLTSFSLCESHVVNH